MRILTLSYEFPPIGGGGAQVVAGLSRELVANGHEVDVVTMGFRGLPPLETVDGVTVHRVPCLRARKEICHPPEMLTYLAAAIPRALRLARSRKFDLNHTHFIFPDGIIAAVLRKRTGLPYIITAHGSDVPGYNPDRFRGYHRLLAPVWRWTTRGTDRLVCPSATLEKLVRDNGYRGAAVRIPNGIDVGRFCPDRVKEDRILVVTRMVPRKGVQYVLEALRGLDTRTYELHIVGQGPCLPTLREKARALDLPVIFHGWIDNRSPRLQELYETSRIFVLPSEAENCPTVLLEAMASGLAVVTSRATGCAELVGDAGVLVEPRNVPQIRQAIEALMAEPDLCERLGRRGCQRVRSAFTWHAIARQYQDVYRAHADPSDATPAGAAEPVPAVAGSGVHDRVLP